MRLESLSHDVACVSRSLQVLYGQADVNFFSLFGASIALGRGFTGADDRPHDECRPVKQSPYQLLGWRG